MTNNSFCDVTDKSSAYNVEYFLCDVCEFNGYPNEKVIFIIHGFRTDNEDGFVTKFTAYDFPIQKEKIHTHKFKEELIKTLAKESLANMEVYL
jgi:hypothetical protein